MSLQVRSSRWNRMLRVGLVIVSVLTAFALLPCPAMARDYSIDRVDIEATVGTDASLGVKEVREFDFDGSFHGVYWKIPTGTYQGRSIETSILSVGEIIDGNYVEFQESSSGANHTYEVSDYYSYIQVKVYTAHEDEKAQIAIVYKDTNLATRYDDTGELYWKFVSDGWDVESQNVSCTIHLPIPSGEEVIGGDNVRAWGHGPLDAVVGFNNGDVIYQVPGVGTSEFAEARIVFPEAWLSDTESVGYTQLDYILQEEQELADKANAARMRARVLMTATGGIGVALPVASLAAMAVLLRKYKVSHKPQFDDKYFRDVPSDDHPAVLGALYNDGNVTGECLTASLMRLTDQGMAKLELIKYKDKGLFGREKVKEDYCLTPTKWPARSDVTASNKQNVDYATMRFVFERLAALAADTSGNHDVLYFSSLEPTAKKHPERYNTYYESWQDAVKIECDRRGFFVDETDSHEVGLIILGVLDVIIGIGLFFAFMFFGASWLMTIIIPLLCIGVGVAVFVVGVTQFDDLSKEAIELKAQLVALRRWLKDFTRLEEAIPTDVVLWNRLLVMAVVLGVADEVIEQLRVAAPEILADATLAPTYGWYYYGGPEVPSRAFTDAISTAHSVSTAQLASSSSSSGGGGGGGFSSGGGGGFGGGGGGGAF